MKKTIVVAIALAAVVALTIAGVAFAQNQYVGYADRGLGDESGPLHEYMENAMAEAVGLSLDEFESRHESGETFTQIALSEGFKAEEIPALMLAAREKALQAAAADGVITAEQAEWMGSRGSGHGGMMRGYEFGPASGDGSCPMLDGDAEPLGGGRGGRW